MKKSSTHEWEKRSPGNKTGTINYVKEAINRTVWKRLPSPPIMWKKSSTNQWEKVTLPTNYVQEVINTLAGKEVTWEQHWIHQLCERH